MTPLLVISVLVSLGRAQTIIDANLIAPTGLVAPLKVKDIVETPNCLPAARLRPLTDQIIGQTNCRARAEIIASIVDSRIDTSRCEYPYLLSGAFESLRAVANDPAAAALPPMQVTAALQPFLNQYFAFRRGYLRICGTTAVSSYVGTTVLEQGASVELANAVQWAPLFPSNVWTRIGNTFTYTGPDSLNAGRKMLEIFQLIWNSAYPWDRIAVTGAFDTETQIRVEQATASGLVFGGLCPSTASGPLSDDTVLMLAILVPTVTLVVVMLLLGAYQTLYLRARTPFDGRGGDMTKAHPLPLPDVDDLINSVENTTDLSDYAQTSSHAEDDGWTTDATSGIWEDD